MKRLLPPAMILLLLAVAGVSGMWHQHQRFLQTPLKIEEFGLLLNVKAGASIRTVVAILVEGIGDDLTGLAERVIQTGDAVTPPARSQTAWRRRPGSQMVSFCANEWRCPTRGQMDRALVRIARPRTYPPAP